MGARSPAMPSPARRPARDTCSDWPSTPRTSDRAAGSCSWLTPCGGCAGAARGGRSSTPSWGTRPPSRCTCGPDSACSRGAWRCSAVRSASATRRRPLGALLVATLVFLALPGTAGAAGQQPSKAKLALTSQSPWVQPGGAFRLGLHVDGVKDPAAVELVLNTYARLTSRSAFGQTLQDRPVGALLDVTSTPLSDLNVDPNSNFAANLSFQDPALPREPGRLLLTQDGVYPLRVELREKGGGAVLDRFTTHIPYAPANRTGPKLDVSWIVPVHAQPSIRPDGTRKLTNAHDLQALAQALETTSVPLVLAPTPETVQALTASSDSAASAALSSLRRAASGRRQVVTGAYVPTNLPQLIAGGLESEADQG